MTIEIHRPELEALILQRMKSSGVHDMEDFLMQALKASPAGEANEQQTRDRRTGADLIAAFQASPHRELNIEPPRFRLTLPLRDVTF